MLAPGYVLIEAGVGWVLAETGGRPLLTPMGHRVASRHRALAERLLDDVGSLGTEATFPPTPYTLQVAYQDFGRSIPLAQVRASVLAGIDPRWDVISQLPADPGAAAALRSAYQISDADGDIDALKRQVDVLPLRALVAVMVFSAHFRSAVLGLKVVGVRADLDRLARGMCSHVLGDGGETVGRQLCSESGEQAAAARPGSRRITPHSCGVRRVLEGFRFFASFPEE